jgi:hypothetical protein
MNVTNRLDAQLEPEEFERFVDGEALRIPTGSQVVVVYPPAEERAQDAEETAEPTEADA